MPGVAFGTGQPKQWQLWGCAPTNNYTLVFADTIRRGMGVITGNFIPIMAGDFDRDGLPDLVGRNYEWTDTTTQDFWNVIAVQECPTPAEPPVKLAWFSRLNRLCAEDATARYVRAFDGDSLTEIVLVTEQGVDGKGLVVYELCSDDSAVLVWGAEHRHSVTSAVGDFDLDGRYEAVTCDYDTVRTVECLGDNRYQAPSWLDRTPYTNGVDVFAGGDVDQNGKSEFYVNYVRYMGISWRHYLYGWEATGDNVYQQFFVDSANGGDGTRSTCGDLDGDGVDELVYSAGGTVLVYKGTSPHEFEDVFRCPTLGAEACAVYDMNRNGYNELVVTYQLTDIYEVEAARVLSPNSGVLRPGDTCRVSWQTFDPPRCDSISLFLRRDSTWLLDTIVTGLAPADTPYCWVVPNIRADSCRLVAIAYGPGWQYDESDSALRIPGGGIGEELPRAAYSFRLNVLPNPVRSRTSVAYEITRSGPVTLAAYDQTGRQVALLASGVHDRGRYRRDWRCDDSQGRRLRAGVYFLRLETPEGRRSQKVVVNWETR